MAEGASDEAQPADEEREGDGILNEARILVSLVAIFWTFEQAVFLCHMRLGKSHLKFSPCCFWLAPERGTNTNTDVSRAGPSNYEDV